MRKQKSISFAIFHLSLVKSLETTLWRSGVEDGNIAFCVLRKSTPVVDAHKTGKTNRDLYRETSMMTYLELHHAKSRWWTMA